MRIRNWEVLEELPNHWYRCLCTICNTESKITGKQLLNSCFECPHCVGWRLNQKVLDHTFGHWHITAHVGGRNYEATCTKCQYRTTLALGSFYYNHFKKNCPKCKPRARYKVKPGDRHGHWHVTKELPAGLFLCKCTLCNSELELKALQIAYPYCRRKCRCQYQKPTHSRRAWYVPTLKHVYGIWKPLDEVGEIDGFKVFKCQCIRCQATSELKGYRIVYPNYAPMCPHCGAHYGTKRKAAKPAERA